MSVEPIHYFRALRRRWWVIVAAVVVASVAAWATTVALASAKVAVVRQTTYSATTTLWATQAPTIGQAVPLPTAEGLVNLVALPEVASIAAQAMDSARQPRRVRHAGIRHGRPGDRPVGDHGHGGEPRTGRRAVDRLLARPHHLPRTLEAEEDHPAGATGAAADPDATRKRVEREPDRIASLDAPAAGA